VCHQPDINRDAYLPGKRKTEALCCAGQRVAAAS
jgi:hypothetical protein